MPYKSQADKRKHDRDDKRKKRGTTIRDDTVGTTEEMFEGRLRYLVLSDGQVLDRANQPSPNKHLPGMEACNRVNDSHPVIEQDHGILDALTDKTKRKKLEKITQSLKDFNASKEIRYGISGPTFDVVGEMLEVTK